VDIGGPNTEINISDDTVSTASEFLVAVISNLFSPVQSVYRKHHFTETALVKIHNDMVTSTDGGHVGVGALELLDLSSAFDTVDQLVLLQILHQRFCVTGSALSWFQSYVMLLGLFKNLGTQRDTTKRQENCI